MITVALISCIWIYTYSSLCSPYYKTLRSQIVWAIAFNLPSLVAGWNLHDTFPQLIRWNVTSLSMIAVGRPGRNGQRWSSRRRQATVKTALLKTQIVEPHPSDTPGPHRTLSLPVPWSWSSLVRTMRHSISVPHNLSRFRYFVIAA